MDLDKVIQELRRERDCLTEAIEALEQLLPAKEQEPPDENAAKKPGRPPGSRNRAP